MDPLPNSGSTAQPDAANAVSEPSDVASTSRTDAVTSGIARTQDAIAKSTDEQRRYASLKGGKRSEAGEERTPAQPAKKASRERPEGRRARRRATSAQVAVLLGRATDEAAGRDDEGDLGSDSIEGLRREAENAASAKRAAAARKARAGSTAKVGADRAFRKEGAAEKIRRAGRAKNRIQSRRTWLKARRAQETRAATNAPGAKAAAEGGARKAIATAVSSAAAPLAGALGAAVFVVIAALLVSQLVSSLFGFWENEEAKKAVEGLPPYLTTEMVEAALECQEQYGHPAGCTLAQIIVESGQGDRLSGLATQDNNLFGIKWASSFAYCPEVAGKHSWSTKEEYGGQTVSIMADFTKFKSMRDCIVFRSRVLLQNQRYAGNALIQQAIAEKSSDKMAEGLKDAGYATSSSYVDSLKQAMDAYGLRRFDGMSLEDFRNGAANGNAIVAAAESQLGVPYVWGGSTPGKGLDCSGLVQYCYAQAGISLPHYSEDQASGGTKIPISQARPGDILWRPGHVAIYIGGDEYIHEPHTGDVCRRATGVSYFTCAIRY